jgi:uncharacterized protein
LNSKDESHSKAVEYIPLVKKLVTTEWVLTELADGLASSRQRGMFVQTREALLADENVQIVAFNMELYLEGIRLYAARPDKEWSLTDCISFVVMRREGLSDALTGDHHFEQAGFTALLR